MSNPKFLCKNEKIEFWDKEETTDQYLNEILIVSIHKEHLDLIEDVINKDIGVDIEGDGVYEIECIVDSCHSEELRIRLILIIPF